jgi:hypothetical protein
VFRDSITHITIPFSPQKGAGTKSSGKNLMASPETARFNTSQNNKKVSHNKSEVSKSSIGSTSKTKKMANTFFNNYGNCTNF